MAAITPKKSKEINAYLSSVGKIFGTGKATELSYRGELQKLLSTLLPGVTVIHEPKRISCGAPDYIIAGKGLPISFVEAKDIGDGDLDGRRNTGNKKQFDRYREALSVIVFTDYLDFHLYIHGIFVESVRIGEESCGKISALPANFEKFLDIVDSLGSAKPVSITSASQLARLMAGKARMLQETTQRFLGGHGGTTPGTAPTTTLDKLLSDFRRVLMPDIDIGEFADIYAQTVTYGMFAARLHDKTPNYFSRTKAASLIPKTNPFLHQLFNQLAASLEPEIEWVVDDIAELFANADVAKIMRGYGKTSHHGDPMIHFYEDFLAAYDAGLRKDRGVWYTPIAVVRFIVRAVDDILQTRFGLKDGLADSTKTDITVEELTNEGKKLARKVRKTVHRVQVLDPATGTGTFLAECIRQIHAKFGGNQGKWQGYVDDDIIPRLNGFELLMASYTMAHIKLDMVLADTGYASTPSKRFNVFLTDSLTPEIDKSLGPLFALILGDEAEAASYVKRDCPVMVVMGNPPYSGESQNKGKWIMSLMEDYKVEPGGKAKLKERNPKWINDDYVKFIRLAEHYVEKNRSGIVAYITPHGFLDNPTFRGMRWHLMQTFDEIWTLNLHGNSKKKEVAPGGGKDECVFSIQQGVAITLMVKREVSPEKDATNAKVHYSDLWGRRKDKLTILDSATLASIKWQTLNPTGPMFFFVPRDPSAETEWNAGFGVAELMGVNGMGVTTGDDVALIADDKNSLLAKVSAKYKIATPSKVRQITYRPFDVRLVYYDANLLARARDKFMAKLTDKGMALSLIRINSKDNGCAALVTIGITDKTILSSKDNANVFPLYLYEENMGKVEKRANMDKDIVAKIGVAIGGTATPEDIFHYIYGVLHSPAYRAKFRELLKSDFPRIPYPKNKEQFEKVASIGRQLVEIHLMRDPAPSITEMTAAFPIGGTNIVEKVVFDSDKVFINDTQHFANVPSRAWNMPIGGYLPAQKWLKDRKDRALTHDDLEHYQRIVLALLHTENLMSTLSGLP